MPLQSGQLQVELQFAHSKGTPICAQVSHGLVPSPFAHSGQSRHFWHMPFPLQVAQSAAAAAAVPESLLPGGTLLAQDAQKMRVQKRKAKLCRMVPSMYDGTYQNRAPAARGASMDRRPEYTAAL